MLGTNMGLGTVCIASDRIVAGGIYGSPVGWLSVLANVRGVRG